MRPAFLVLLAGGALALAGGCGKTSTYPTPDGSYVIMAAEADGQPEGSYANRSESDRTITFSGNTMTRTRGDTEISIDVTYDATKTPAHITMTENKPGGRVESTYGIYKIDGDTLTICMKGVGEGKEVDRPKEFKTVKGGKEFLMTLRKK
jgi:uncharacterized protein (TIGR03067 family)